MKLFRPIQLLTLIAVTIMIAFVFIIRSQAQQRLPYDTQAVFRTHVPHLGSSHGGGGGGGGKPGSGGGGSVSFTGPDYSSIGPTVTPTTTGPEAEEYIAVDPVATSTLVAAISDFSLRSGSNTTKFAVSTNAGASWAESYVPLNNGAPATGDGRVWPYNSDPVMAIAADGTAYLADLYFHSETGDNSNGLYVSVGNTSAGPSLGITAATTYAVAVQSDPNTNVNEDKEWIAAGPGANVYVSWTRFVGNTDMILFARSTDHGQTWSSPIQISPVSQNGAVQGSSVAVGPSGEIYVAYEVFFVGSNRQQFLSKSVDSGQSFSAAAAITPTFGELTFNSTYRKNSFPAIAVGSNGNVYLVYADQGGRNARVQFSRSTHAGGSFSSPLSLNDSSTGQRLMPSIATDEAGGIHVSWFDTRLAVNTTASYDIFATRSIDSGGTFSPNARVTAATISAGSASFIGDYGGTAARAGSAYPVWTDGGFNNGQLQLVRLQY